ncbi:hypothetical protein AMECASPLE_039155 [Ameca splendens]|uniref:Uncharacterized protein n=1 Tax=Ameca splendens TaxID=208324 RepID=A0ABV0XLR3_9TELE
MTKNISYAEAVKNVQNERSRDESQIRIPDYQQRKVESEENVTMSVEKLILFIAYVINCTEQAKHKTEKIKIIVRGAEKFLGFKEGSWENINKKLETDGRQGGTPADRNI